MQNKHTVLPPDHKSLWKEFQTLKQKDVKEGKAWMYDADPFKVVRDRQEAKAAAEKKRAEIERVKEKSKSMNGASGLVHTGGFNPMKGWTNIPRSKWAESPALRSSRSSTSTSYGIRTRSSCPRHRARQ